MVRRYVRNHIGDPRKLSQGARAWLHGPFSVGPEPRSRIPVRTPSFGSNVDANDPSRDVAAGQAETAIAATSRFVVAAWNDASGALYTDSTKVQASITGVGVSSDGGTTFSDLVGLPNGNPNQQWSGDPAVVALDDSHFIVGSLYFPSFFSGCTTGPAQLTAAVSVATVVDGGAIFTRPIIAVQARNACGRRSPPDLSLIDKEFLSYDAVSRTLAMSYTRFFLSGTAGQSGLGQIEVVRATVPDDPTDLRSRDFSASVTIWHEEPSCTYSSEASQCGALNQGSYPAVAPGGDVYVVWERNVLSNLFFSGDPYVYIHAALVPAGADGAAVGGQDDPLVITEGQVNATPDGGVRSLDAVAIAGYNRGLGQDFPRIAFDAPANAVVFVWNDGALHPLGDVWLRLADTDLSSLGTILRVNDDSSYALHFMPAVSVGSDGSIRTSWYDRRRTGPDSSDTEYFGEIRPAGATSAEDFPISSGPTDWLNTSTLFGPNFGDYTDNATVGTRTYFMWTDGRLGIPQPFVDRRG